MLVPAYYWCPRMLPNSSGDGLERPRCRTRRVENWSRTSQNSQSCAAAVLLRAGPLPQKVGERARGPRGVRVEQARLARPRAESPRGARGAVEGEAGGPRPQPDEGLRRLRVRRGILRVPAAETKALLVSLARAV